MDALEMDTVANKLIRSWLYWKWVGQKLGVLETNWSEPEYIRNNLILYWLYLERIDQKLTVLKGTIDELPLLPDFPLSAWTC